VAVVCVVLGVGYWGVWFGLGVLGVGVLVVVFGGGGELFVFFMLFLVFVNVWGPLHRPAGYNRHPLMFGV
ncbi:hypothetical protein AAGG49_21910, partial [Stenotrophomonas maltophilia]|uniref:hypothetical protein n=1 Tax=Stenotrophomonas maltophilia TaxID=40324 RepID=UPI00313CE9BA